MAQKYRLPKTHYDFLQAKYPWLIEAAVADAERLRPMTQSVFSADDYETRHSEVLDESTERFIEDMCRQTGLPASEIRYQAETLPAARQSMAQLIGTVSMSYHCALNLELSGRKVFYLSENLIEKLSETELSVAAEDLEMPFPSCLFVYQGGNAHELFQRIFPSGETTHTRDGSELPISVYATLGPSREFPGRRALIFVSVMADTRTGRQLALAKRELLLTPGRSVEDALHTDWEKERANTGKPSDPSGGWRLSESAAEQSKSDDLFYTDGLQFYRLVLNTILYLMSDGAERREMKGTQQEILDEAEQEKSAKQRRKKQSFAQKFSAEPYILLGESVAKISERGGNRHTSETGKRIIVRGHFKNQPHGPERKLRKHIWVQPYYRGPEMADLVNKPYVVK